MIVIGSKESEHVLIQNLEQMSNDGWCQAEVYIQVNRFTGHINPYFELHDISSFYQQSVNLYNELKGQAELNPIEGQFSLVLTGDGKGHIKAKGTAFTHATYGSCLEYEFEIDQTHLPNIIKSLKTVLEAHGKNT